MKPQEKNISFPRLVIILMLMSGSADGFSQNARTSSLITIEPQFIQLKDQKNYGLVFNGGNISVGYTLQKQSGENLFYYDADFGFGAGFSKGIAGINFHLKPAGISYCFPVVQGEKATLYIGPYLTMNYNLQLYPELQSGHALWFTFYDLGPRFIVDMRLKEQTFRIQLANSIFGLVSRPVEMNETYYYTLNFFDLMGKVHSNFRAGSFNLLNHTDFELEWRQIGGSNKSLAYRIEYFHYKKEPRLQYLVHSISYRIKLGGKK
jgi:hypothetical protein